MSIFNLLESDKALLHFSSIICGTVWVRDLFTLKYSLSVGNH